MYVLLRFLVAGAASFVALALCGGDRRGPRHHAGPPPLNLDTDPLFWVFQHMETNLEMIKVLPVLTHVVERVRDGMSMTKVGAMTMMAMMKVGVMTMMKVGAMTMPFGHGLGVQSEIPVSVLRECTPSAGATAADSSGLHFEDRLRACCRRALMKRHGPACRRVQRRACRRLVPQARRLPRLFEIRAIGLWLRCGVAGKTHIVGAG